MASNGPAPLARMYREQLGRRARPVGIVGLLPELNGFSFETEEYYTNLLTLVYLPTATRSAATRSLRGGGFPDPLYARSLYSLCGAGEVHFLLVFLLIEKTTLCVASASSHVIKCDVLATDLEPLSPQSKVLYTCRVLTHVSSARLLVSKDLAR